ncbi:MAG TPA: hypothetical protein VJ570_12565 [Holophagaceae bacterium]|nr:hypothetical protein [Holophagaceae bacterium]
MRPWQARAGLLAAACLAHGRGLRGVFQYDDFNVIVHNPAVHDLGHWHRGLRPLLTLSYALNWAADPGPFGFLCVNLALHALNILLVHELIRALAPRLGLGERAELPALAGALVFALHPVQTEAVAYVSGRSASLMATGFLAALLAVVRGRPVAALLGFGCAVAAKETALIFPAVVLILPDGDGEPAPRWVRRGIPILGLGLLGGLLLHPAYGRLVGFSLEVRGASAQLQSALVGFGYLGRKLLWPVGLNIDPPLAVPGGWTSGTASTLLILVGLGALAGAAARRRPWLAFGFSCFLLTLLPVLGPLPRLDPANERHLYLPLAGGAILVAGLCAEPRLRPWALPAAAVACGLMALGLQVRLGDYRSEIALWESSLRVAPDNARARNNLGTALALAGRRAEAQEAYREALRLRPDYTLARENLRGLE